jgi:hypothetical protein
MHMDEEISIGNSMGATKVKELNEVLTLEEVEYIPDLWVNLLMSLMHSRTDSV